MLPFCFKFAFFYHQPHLIRLFLSHMFFLSILCYSTILVSCFSFSILTFISFLLLFLPFLHFPHPGCLLHWNLLLLLFIFSFSSILVLLSPLVLFLLQDQFPVSSSEVFRPCKNSIPQRGGSRSRRRK